MGKQENTFIMRKDKEPTVIRDTNCFHACLFLPSSKRTTLATFACRLDETGVFSNPALPESHSTNKCPSGRDVKQGPGRSQRTKKRGMAQTRRHLYQNRKAEYPNQRQKHPGNPVCALADADIWRYFSAFDVPIYAEERDFDGVHGLMVYNKTEQTKELREGSTSIHSEYVQRSEWKEVTDWIIAVGRHRVRAELDSCAIHPEGKPRPL